MLKAEKIALMRVNASHISALIGMLRCFLFVLLMYLFHSLRVCGRGACLCELYLA
jgi:hypothetical protein